MSAIETVPVRITVEGIERVGGMSAIIAFGRIDIEIDGVGFSFTASGCFTETACSPAIPRGFGIRTLGDG